MLQVFLVLLGLFAQYLGVQDIRFMFLLLVMSSVIDRKTRLPYRIRQDFVNALKRKKKRFRSRQRKKKGKHRRTKKFRRRALPYHLLQRCRRREGNRPPMFNGSMSLAKFSRLKKLLKRLEKLLLSNCHKYVEGLHSWSESWAKRILKPQKLDPVSDLGGVHPRVAELFFNLHNPMIVQQVMAGKGMTWDTFLSQTPSNTPDLLSTLCLRLAEVHKKLKSSDLMSGFRDMPCIWDTGASIGLTPFKSDFIDYQKLENVHVKDIARKNKVLGVGTVMWKFFTRSGREVFLPLVCYHVEHAEIRLMSPQQYFKNHGGSATISDHTVSMTLPDGEIIDIPIDPRSNLPMIRNVQTSSKQQRDMGPHLMSAHVGNTFEPFNKSQKRHRINQCVADETNQNLSAPQKELLLWHWRLSINMDHVQELMRPRIYKVEGRDDVIMPPIIPTKHATAKSCAIPMCMSCELAKMKARSPKVKTTKIIKEKDGILKRDKYEPGDMVSSDQFNVHTAGRSLKGYGRESAENGLHGGTLYVDSASGLIRVECQVSMGAVETLVGKEKFEQWVWDLAAVCVKNYHSDNGVYDTEAFRRDCTEKDQKQTFSGVGAKHQNAIAERNIQTICYWARTMMVHAAIHWPSDGADNLRLWAFAIKQSEWLYNRIPNRKTGLTPFEIFTKTKSDHRDLLRSHVWGCPVYVLDPTLQDGKKIPKWNKRSRLGQFLGFSDEHSSLVARVRHLTTNYVSPQFHVVFDDLFQTVLNDANLSETEADAIFQELFEDARDWYAEIERDSTGAIVYEPPLLDDIWLSEAERRQKRVILQGRRDRENDRWMQRARDIESEGSPTDTPTAPPTNNRRSPLFPDDEESSAGLQDSDDDSFGGLDEPGGDDGIGNSSPEGAPIPHPTPIPTPTPRPTAVPTVPEGANVQQRRSGRNRKPVDRNWGLHEHPQFNACYNITTLDVKPLYRHTADLEQFACTFGPKQPPVLASMARHSRSDRKYEAQFNRRVAEFEEASLNNLDWGNNISVGDFLQSDMSSFVTLSVAYSDVGSDFDLGSFYCDYVSPMILAAKTAASKDDNPNWGQAMNGPFCEEYFQASELEIETLEKADAWRVVERTPDMNVLPSTWAFKCKRFPDGSVKKFKARFCARGDRQKEGIDYFETYAPVVQWTTIRIMLILECVLGLVSKQGDVTCAFLHAHLEEGEKVYLEMPQGFKQYDKNGKPKVYSLKRTLYGLKQSPRAFWKYLTSKFEAVGLKQSNLDPCLFIGTKVICIVYVDDLLFWSVKEEFIYDVGIKLRDQGVELEEEGDAAGFLGVELSRTDDGRIHMVQTGLIRKIIETIGLSLSESTPKGTPAERKPLVKDLDGEPPQESFNYASVVGMLLYLSGHTRPDLAYSVSQVARFMFNNRRSHELALKRIGRYLIGTADKGMFLTPKDTLDIDAFPDADFAGLYGYEDLTDPVCVRSRTGYVILVANCPVLWKSQLQTETATSTMHSEIIAMAACCKELFPIMDMVELIRLAVGMNKTEPTKFHVTIHEDNSGALILAKTLPPQFTPRSKFYALKTIWFREKIVEYGIVLVKVDTTLQLGDICTKMPPQVVFVFLRKEIQGW